MTSISRGINPSHILSLHKIGFKLVPILEDAFTPSIAWAKVYESGWTVDELSKLEFSNIATCFGMSHLEDKEGKALYLNCLDIDSEEVFTRLAVVTDENGKERFFIGELCEHTYVTKTRKKDGRHLYWLSHNLNPAIHSRDCKLGHEFEIKTDNTSGLASLPPSIHRADSGFHYQNIGQNHIMIDDSLYGIITRMLDDCLKKANRYQREQYESAEEHELRDTEIDVICSLISPIYRVGSRHQLCYSIAGILHRRKVSLDSASRIINIIARKDEEKKSRLGVMRHTYSKNRNEVSGRTELFETLRFACNDSAQALETLRGIINILNNTTAGVTEQNHRIIADELSSEFHFKVMRDSREVYYFDKKIGVYRPQGDTIIREQLELLYPDITTRHVTEIVEKIRRRNTVDRIDFDSKPNIRNVKNGILDVLSGQLVPHTPDFLSMVQIPVIYNPNAKCPIIMRFFSQVLRPRNIFTIIQFCGYCLLASAKYEKALFLIGDGDNGKGTLLRLLEAFLGNANISHASLEEVSDDKFAAADLYGKLANICADIEQGKIRETSTFKRLTSGDIIRAQKKHQASFDFANHAKLIFSSNFMPQSSDNTYAWYKRLIPLLFLNTFDENKDVFLLEKLTREEELSGLLNLAIIGLRQLTKEGRFNHIEDIRSTASIYSKYADSAEKFVKEKCILHSGACELSNILFQAYQHFCKGIGLTPLSNGSFGGYLNKIGVKKDRPMVSGVRSYTYKGIKLKPQSIA